ncbi:electron transfer flavoprotein subunit alpha/FixB family protein [Carboxydothermus hydrogenoformans]|uniref:Electron transfer flavoprotein, alpha subunit n=1 Tax=Carboxydothermus hydrogenoformans (strain ATCC BAA-161 / DSM 6008 / Z-2901) TaxID=246194 RepID=Q3A9B3_CARHZ|nr:electron transfer flavoprotein subunit alpha/FixB family protein [Carboxydothermus hydrogenoformans]ABB14632.1 electron transfer flavoprotein, alpha subunit [Carboxydothermus hydrogenoformans Z-2901]
MHAQGVWVFVEHLGGEIAPVTFELLGKGRELADDLETELAAVLLGDGVRDFAEQLFRYGADKVYLIDDPVLKDYRTYPYAKGIVKLAQKYTPEIILIGATTLGRDLAGVVATWLNTGLTADCTELSIDKTTRLLHQTRPAFGGNIMATILCKTARPQMATVRPRVFPLPEPKPRIGVVVEEELGILEEEVPTRIIKYEEEKGPGVYLDKAEIIVAGGRGLGSKKNFRLVEELAEVLGGVVGASRPAVEAGWVPYAHQIGQTGQTVRPKLYIACGISGAVQHLVGMQMSEVIVAINNDPNAPIFNIATYGIVGDILEVLPAITEEARRVLAGQRGVR